MCFSYASAYFFETKNNKWNRKSQIAQRFNFSFLFGQLELKYYYIAMIIARGYHGYVLNCWDILCRWRLWFCSPFLLPTFINSQNKSNYVSFLNYWFEPIHERIKWSQKSFRLKVQKFSRSSFYLTIKKYGNHHRTKTKMITQLNFNYCHYHFQ